MATDTWLSHEHQDEWRVTVAQVGGLLVREVEFDPGAAHGVREPERGYLVVVLGGSGAKSFRHGEVLLEEHTVVSVPAGAAHSARFGAAGACLITISPPPERLLPAPLFERVGVRRDSRITSMARRIGAELHGRDAVAPLAVEALTLELLAAACRVEEHRGARPQRWLYAVRDLLHEEPTRRRTLTELAASAGVSPDHLNRVFRAHFGVSVATYARRARLDAAAAAIALEDKPLSVIAAELGFSDQSHLTREFARHTGLTPGRYRAALRGDRAEPLVDGNGNS